MAADTSWHHLAIKQKFVRHRPDSLQSVRISFCSVENYQCTLPLDPAGPGEKVPWSGTFSPGTVPPLCELDSSMTASFDAQAEIRNVIAKSKTAYDAKREIIGSNLTRGIFDASRGVR